MDDHQRRLHKRITWLMIGFFVISALFVLRLGWLQLVQGRHLATLASTYHSRTIFYGWGHGNEGRGDILDRNLRPLTGANPSSGLAVFTALGRQDDQFAMWMDRLQQYSGMEQEQIIERSRFRLPLPLVQPVPEQWELPHWIVPVQGDWNQRYAGDLACHVLGRVQPRDSSDDPGHLVGRLGIEAAYDDLLRCTRPGIAAMSDGLDNLISGLGYRYTIDPDQVPNVVLSLDSTIQRRVEQIFDDYIDRGRVPATGAIVVMDPHTGDILAMVSRPVLRGGDHQYNRAVRKSDNVDMLPLASVVKVVTAAAALEQNPDLLASRHTCDSMLTLQANQFRCVYGPHGEQDMAQALANSCNIYFAHLAIEVGGEALLEMASNMGLGSKPNLGLPDFEQYAGSLPQRQDLATSAGLANHFAMGGNMLEVTPVQVAAMVGTIANGGNYVEPRLVLATNQDIGAKITPPKATSKRIMGTATAQVVARMMHASVQEGSAGLFNQQDFAIAANKLAAKTGTSDSGLPPRNYQISWNAGFFPWRSPRYVVVYMAEVPPGQGVHREQIVAEITEAILALENR